MLASQLVVPFGKALEMRSCWGSLFLEVGCESSKTQHFKFALCFLLWLKLSSASCLLPDLSHHHGLTPGAESPSACSHKLPWLWCLSQWKGSQGLQCRLLTSDCFSLALAPGTPSNPDQYWVAVIFLAYLWPLSHAISAIWNFLFRTPIILQGA